MLLYLSIKNVAVIENADIELGQGLNILTGETGAGKSIVIDSVNLSLGERADKNLIRTGADKASVEAIFDITNSIRAKELLKSFINSDENELVIRRELSISGRNICRINGHISTLTQLKEITSSLIDIHGQHQHQSLLDEDNHIKVVDGFSATLLYDIKNDYQDIYQELRKIHNEISSKRLNEQERIRQIEMLNFQINEIDSATLVIDEDTQLRKSREILLNAEDIKTSIDVSYNAFNGYSQERTINILLTEAIDSMTTISKINIDYGVLAKRMEELLIESEDISEELRSIGNTLDFSAHDMEKVESRLELIKKLCRKYGNSVSEILEYRQEIGERLYELDENEVIIQELLIKEKKLYNKALSLAKKMSIIRNHQAKKLEKQILEQLKYLGMENSKFVTKFTILKTTKGKIGLTKNGFDKINFVISTNPGEALKPLSHVVSGGELSRIMLILKSITAQNDNIDTLIFDEIDTGISGEMARVVGEKLSSIGKGHQVICVTHSAQIAAFADNHIYIKKQSSKTSTKTSLESLDKSQRYKEISRLVGGSTLSSLSDEHAKQIVSWADNYKKSSDIV